MVVSKIELGIAPLKRSVTKKKRSSDERKGKVVRPIKTHANTYTHKHTLNGVLYTQAGMMERGEQGSDYPPSLKLIGGVAPLQGSMM